MASAYEKLARDHTFWIHLLHVLVAGPLVAYTGIYGLSTKKLPYVLAVALLVIGLVTITTQAWMLAKQVRAAY